MYEVFFTSEFKKHFLKLARNNRSLKEKVEKTIKTLKNDPAYPSLKSHKVTTKSNGEKWSSWVTGDLRLIWDFEGKLIVFHNLGTHSGKHRVYN